MGNSSRARSQAPRSQFPVGDHVKLMVTNRPYYGFGSDLVCLPVTRQDGFQNRSKVYFIYYSLFHLERTGQDVETSCAYQYPIQEHIRQSHLQTWYKTGLDSGSGLWTLDSGLAAFSFLKMAISPNVQH